MWLSDGGSAKWGHYGSVVITWMLTYSHFCPVMGGIKHDYYFLTNKHYGLKFINLAYFSLFLIIFHFFCYSYQCGVSLWYIQTKNFIAMLSFFCTDRNYHTWQCRTRLLRFNSALETIWSQRISCTWTFSFAQGRIKNTDCVLVLYSLAKTLLNKHTHTKLCL